MRIQGRHLAYGTGRFARRGLLPFRTLRPGIRLRTALAALVLLAGVSGASAAELSTQPAPYDPYGTPRNAVPGQKKNPAPLGLPVPKEISGLEERVLTRFGQVRRFWVKRPRNHDGRRLEPLLLLLHGADMDGARMLRSHGWAARSDQDSFFIVSPDALPLDPSRATAPDNPRLWRAGGEDNSQLQVNDVSWLNAVIDEARNTLPIDPRRVYVAGFGEGGSMALRMAAENPRAFAAAASVGGLLQVPLGKLPYPLSVLLLTGGKDPLLPVEGGSVTLPWGQTVHRPAPGLTFEVWGQSLKCRSAPEKVRTRWTDIWLRQMRRCEKRAVVRWFHADDLGHHWPGGGYGKGPGGGSPSPWPESIAGPWHNEPEATHLIWNFFARHVKSWK